MGIIIRKPGILSTVQDLGRVGYRNLGINPGGVMDAAAVRILNTLIGNADSAAVLEMHFPAAEVQFETEAVFAIGGADFAPTLDGEPVANWKTNLARPGSVLSFGKKQSGERAYLAVRGGFETETWLASRSTNTTAAVGGISGRALRAGNHLPCSPSSDLQPRTAGMSIRPPYHDSPVIRIVAGAEFGFMTALSERDLIESEFILTTSCDRMGYRLDGPPLHLLDEIQMVSSGVNFGTIQLLPDGQLIVLMADHQTSGGYPRIANVIPSDLPLLAQCGPGKRIRFAMTDLAYAEDLILEFEKGLSFLKLGCRLQTRW